MTTFDSPPQQTKDMEPLSTLAGGIAHQFNNALVGIAGNIELLKMDLPENEVIDKYVDSMKVSIRKMVGLTNQLLAFAHGGRYHPQTITLSDFVEGSLPAVLQRIGPGIRLQTDLPLHLRKVEADLTQMQMVLTALVDNAIEAIEGQGCIRITSGNEDFDETLAVRHDLRAGHYAYLRVQDDGKGMDEKTMSRIFQPFFTTKFQGRGLSMAAVYGIIRNHGGRISIESEPTKGTTITVYLPAAEVHKENAHTPESTMTRGTGHPVSSHHL